MAKLIYSTITSLDCFVEDSDGGFDWAEPDEEVFSFVNQLERTIGTYLFGRRMYETMDYWESASTQPDQSAVENEFAEMWGGGRQDCVLDHAHHGEKRENDNRTRVQA